VASLPLPMHGEAMQGGPMQGRMPASTPAPSALSSPAPDAAQQALAPPTLAEALPVVAPPPPPAAVETAAPVASPVPQARPEGLVASRQPQQQPARASAPRTAAQAAGQGATGQRGDQGRAAAATLSDAARQSLMASWGGQIRAQIERSRPRTTQRGTVRVALTVARDGRLVRAGVASSSGSAELDRAALTMVQGAGRFRAAPSGLSDPDYSFRLPIRFD